MIVTPQETIAEAVEKFSAFLHQAEGSNIKDYLWESEYKHLKVVSALFDTSNWDEIEQLVDNDERKHIKQLRGDPIFKEYFKHRRELDRLMRMI